MKKLKIAFVTYYKNSDLKNHHAALYYILKSIQDLGHEVVVVDDLDSFYQRLFKLKSFYYYKIKKSNYNRLMEKSVTKSIARIAQKKIENIENIDLIIAPGTLEVAYLRTNIPIIIWTDTPFQGLIDIYNNYSGLNNRFMKNCKDFDYIAHKKSKHVIYPSEWAVNLAEKEYVLDDNKVKFIRFGSTLGYQIDIDTVNRLIYERIKNPKLRLFFAAIEWERKGGPKIWEILRQIKLLGISFQLDIAGVQIKVPEDLEENVIIHGFLNKSNPDQFDKYINLFKFSHFFIMPTIGDTFGLVFADASSIGLPSIAANAGGIPSVISSGENGFVFDVNAEPSEMALKIIEVFNNKKEYAELCNKTFQFYQKNLNWEKLALKLQALLDQIK